MRRLPPPRESFHPAAGRNSAAQFQPGNELNASAIHNLRLVGGGSIAVVGSFVPDFLVDWNWRKCSHLPPVSTSQPKGSIPMIPANQVNAVMPTVDSPSPYRAPASGGKHSDVSRPKMGFVEGVRPHFSDETASLLRSRLTAITLALSIVLLTSFVSNLFTEFAPLVGFRAVTLLAFVASFLALRSSRPFSLLQLRSCEATLFGLLAVQVLAMMSDRLIFFARVEDLVSVVATHHVYLGTWALLMLTYGILMPNTWQRALAILLPTACLPFGLLLWLRWQVPGIEAALAADKMENRLPLVFVAAGVAVFGTYTIHAVRREAFKAKQLGQYILKTKLGAGGLGEVYKAEHQLLKRPCAIKLIKPGKTTDAAALVRFEREVQATAMLTHWNTVEIFDYGHAEDGTFYYVMELLPGLTLENLVRGHGPLPPERAVHFLRQVCKALREAHAKGLIHRDIKPANIFAAERGGVYDVAKLLDFGLVKDRVAGDKDAKLPQIDSFSGSPLYMCPEQSKAYDKLDARSDIYSLGAVAYYLVTGKPPFVSDSIWDIIASHAHDPVVPPSRVNAAVPPDLELVIIRCLAKMPANRFQDAESLEEALAACQCAGKWTEEQATAWWQKVEQPCSARN
jgi:eukaryotic-like serine/threonine-protein kinase